ncbi:mitogen-activated protein kinase kinase kinase 1-like [Phalaenopsis equestris]|uniref:mitogen-activated protein kinase kinase kinase 1-like n=1 Tax=Phalaenopsis equestris TaxID=78828 RepID=UPI0009E64B83|nr:mitogen-activated protein kinase kinase kinase 1-like [Phalaenopsis equestris]XP_020591329.1 mitogen-activated protein kinase kinase kinase 1-like [Phalaenopsis equestris]XP_020591330.1 mitogen-activated protein kinase kinase kinase 1-like [Phalaenopsis equestris]
MFSFGRKKFSRSRDMTMSSVRRPKLERRNASKKIDYDASRAPSSSDETPALVAHSLDLSPAAYSDQTSFRIGGSIEGEVELLYRSLGLSGPEDFAIPAAAWEASLKARSSCDLILCSRFVCSESSAEPQQNPPLTADSLADGEKPMVDDKAAKISHLFGGGGGVGDGGIKSTRPPVLATPQGPISALYPPPGRSVLKPPAFMKQYVPERTTSPWDIASANENDDGTERKLFNLDEKAEKEGDERMGCGEASVRFGETSEDCTGSFSTSNDDDSSSTTTESMFVISPYERLQKIIGSWMRGQLLGTGSFGTVYEGISDDGRFFAVKEVSLLEKGSCAQQCILQLEQEIALLSQFEHENIVQYYGTDKEESKLFIFLELVTQGSLASLYQKYKLRDTQVSAYTRQILNGLQYLHERNVVHRDIKCANILVHANGSVKLADFGLAKEISKLNDLKSCKGSVYWMAPEVVHPKKAYGHAADIWSLGCTVLEMLTRQIPYPNVEWQHAFFKIGQGDQPPIPTNLSKQAQDFIRKCVQVDPNCRPTAAQLLDHPFVRRPMKIHNQ